LAGAEWPFNASETAVKATILDWTWKAHDGLSMTGTAPWVLTWAEIKFPYAPATTERSIEIPWALSRCGRGENILEVGCSFAYESPQYVQGLTALGGELHGIDISGRPAPDFIQRIADIRASGYADNFFDMVLCVSTLEHVGRDNARHYFPVAEIATPDPEPDRAALLEMTRILKPGGNLLVTVPFGYFVDYEWFINYDAANIARLLREVMVVAADYFKLTPDGWVPCAPDELAEVRYGDNGAPAACGVGCFQVGKR
jgi:SAM-dependent methyltransferase